MRQMLGEEGAVCPVCRRDMDGQAHTEATDYYNAQEQKLLNERQMAQDTVLQLEASLDTWLAEKASFENERNTLANQVALKTIQEEIKRLQNDITTLRTSLSTMADAPQLRADAEAAFISSRDARDQHNNLINKLTTDRTAKIEEIGALTAQIANLPSLDELQRREDEYNSLVDKINQYETLLGKLASIDDKVKNLQNELATLEDPREKRAIAQNIANKRETLENQHQGAQDVLAAAQSELEDVHVALQPYRNLDNDMVVARERHNDTAEGHQLYMEHKQIANLLNERESQLTEIRTELADTVDKRDDLVQQRDNLTEKFDQEHYMLGKQRGTELERNQTILATQLENLKAQLSKTVAEIEELRTIVGQIQKLQATGERLKNEQTSFEFVRRSIRDAGPRIRKRKVQFVSEVAANYFSEIINDFTMRLQWDADDYGIYIEQSGEKRPFNVLSGGEQMIAALSVRLALLTHMTRIRLIFLDEPTINLDENRRIQLAERLKQIDGLQQLFVISHDDTFIGECNHVINVIKEAGVSRVEMSHAALY